jgi:hypothetical protein
MQNPASDVDRHVTSRPLETPSLDLDLYVRSRHQTVRSTPVSSLWTPDGEHKIDRPKTGSEPPDARTGAGPPDRQGSGTSHAQVDAEGAPVDQAELDEIREQLLEAPVEVVVANHAYGLFELAALHLSAQPPNLEKARLAVDALGAMVEGLEGRLGNVEQALTDALAQIRLAYVQISAQIGASSDSDGQQSA